MIYSSFHMTQGVAVAILPRMGRTGVLRHFFILPRIRRIGRIHVLRRDWKQNKNKKKFQKKNKKKNIFL